MRSTDKQEFATLISRTWRFYGKTPTGEDTADWFDLLESFPLEAVAAAFKRHLTDPERGQYPPKPADVIRHLNGMTPSDGRPGPDEAWGLLLRFINNEADTGLYSEEMRAGWEACDPILKLGDEVGARKCFIETYARAVQDARQQHRPARWTVTLGTDPALRQQRLVEAVEARRIGRDQVTALLPGPAPASLDQVAGLLEGPNASRHEAQTAERLRMLARMIRASAAEDIASRAEERRRQREVEEAHRAELLQQLEQRTGSLDAA